MYKFEYDDLEYGKGSLAELIAYDRYALTSHDLRKAKEGDVIIFVVDKEKGSQKVGTIVRNSHDLEMIAVEAHDGSGEYSTSYDQCRVVLETKPSQMWTRWAKGAASVETTPKLQDAVASEFGWLLDGYRYVLGGRIQAMLGHEYAGFGLDKSKLTAFNCLVLPSPDCSTKKTPVKNWLAILDVAKREANSMAYGSGVGINLSTIAEKIMGPANSATISARVDKKHSEYNDFETTHFSGFTSGDKQVTPKTITVEDSRAGIFDALATMVKCIYKGKDVVLNLSELREKGAYVKGIDGLSSGLVSWAKLFDFVASLLKKDSINAVDVAELYAFVPNLISQGGQRRGALMEVLDIDHPDIMEYIEAKQTAGRITGANLSVNVTDKFMNRYFDGEQAAIEMMDYITDLAHKTAEPGVLFMERANFVSNTNYYQTINTTNPCGEIPLPPNGVCNLAHLNLPMFMFFDEATKRWEINWEDLALAIKLGVRFNDNVIDYGTWFDEDIKRTQQGDRRVGIGSMGIATVLIRMGLRYGSDEAIKFCDDLYQFIARHAYDASVKLGEEKGSFPMYDPSQVSNNSFLYKIMDGRIPSHIRNCSLLTQAPTGSTGTMIDNLPRYNCSTGIEPYFAFKYYRAGRLGVAEQEVELVQEWRDLHPGEDLPSYFVDAQSVTAVEHVKMQGVIQKWVDSSISKTINLPSDATVEDVKQAYILAYQLGCKGVTVYRDGSRSGQVLATKKEDAKLEDVVLSTDRKDIKEEVSVPQEQFTKRNHVLPGSTFKSDSPFGKMYVTVNTDPDRQDIEEVFIRLSSKHGTEIQAIMEALGLTLTLALSDRLSSLPNKNKLDWITHRLKGLKGGNPIGFGPSKIESLPDALGKILEEVLNGVVEEDVKEVAPAIQVRGNFDICPSCGEATLIKEEGCEHCHCGFSRCS